MDVNDASTRMFRPSDPLITRFRRFEGREWLSQSPQAHDPHQPPTLDGGWNPAQGVLLPGGDPIVTIKDLFRFAGVLS